MKLEATYNRTEQEKLILEAQDRAEKADNALGRAMGWRKSALEEVEAHQMTLDSITQREDEQREALESKIFAERQQAGYDLPAPEMEPEEPELDLQDQYREAAEPDSVEQDTELSHGVEENLSDQYEQAASPAPEIEQPEPEPQIEQPDLSQQYDNAAQTQKAVSTPSQDTTPAQGQSVDQSHDSGQSQSGPSHDAGGMSR